MFTIPEVGRALNIEPNNHLHWEVGAQARAIYEERYGRIPQKVLRSKTTGPGSHCFAVYPEYFRSVVEQLFLGLASPRDPGAEPPEGYLF